MTITFPNEPASYTVNTTVAFPAIVNNAKITCEISSEALCDYFNAKSRSGHDLLAIFNANRSAIESKAAQVLAQRVLTDRCILTSEDFK